jgi:DNA helicase-2/ATP-dependent DNA helicase PcrA
LEARNTTELFSTDFRTEAAMATGLSSTGLNPAQLEAVRTLGGPLLVLAGAGTGKTRVVTYRIANLIRNGVKPDRILAVTFTKKAAAEMLQRATALLVRKAGRGGRPASGTTGNVKKQSKKDALPRPEISTFHSLCVRILRRHIKHLGYPEKFVICDRGEQEGQARAVLRELRAPNGALAPGDLLAYIGRWKTAAVRPDGAVGSADGEREQLASIGYRRYQDNLKKLGAVDFDDLLLLTEELFQRFPAVRKEEAARFDHVMIDEYQDTNQSQYQIVKGLAKEHRNLCVVGDDDQSIYAWRGAEVTHILRFQQDWAKTKVVRLEDNYRSTAEILHYANTLIAFNRTRHEKTLRAAKSGGTRPIIMQCKDETDEAIRVVASIRRQLDESDGERRIEPRDVAILCRTNEQPRSFETELRRANVPYVLIGGMSFFDRKEVRDILAYLKVIDNPRDEPALRRIINQPPRGIGDAAQKRLLEEATAHGKMLWDVLENALVVDGIDAKTGDAAKRFVRLIKQFQAEVKKGGIAQLIARVIDDISYRDSLMKLYPDPAERESRLAALEEIVNAAGSYDAGRRDKEGSLGGFLDDVLLGEREENDEKESQLARNAVALMTLHSAKGLEFPHVYLVGMEEGILPHKRSVEAEGAAIDEERRLCYVGVTRAREQLTLSFALTRRKWGKPRKTVPSRFLYEMTGQADNPRSPTAPKPKSKTAARPVRTRRQSKSASR